MIREFRLQPLHRPHGHGVGAAEEERQQRHEQADANTLEDDHDERAGKRRDQQEAARTEVRTQPLQQTPDVR